MRLWIVIFLLLLAGSAAAKSYTLLRGESVDLDGTNITLLATSTRDDNVLLCVNNQKAIVTDSRRVGYALIEVDEVDKASARLTIDVDCQDDCLCNDCDNSLCSPPAACPEDDVSEGGWVHECEASSDCDDGLACTEDLCTQIKKECRHTEIPGCGNPLTGRVALTVNPPEGNQMPGFTIVLLLLAFLLGGMALWTRPKHL